MNTDKIKQLEVEINNQMETAINNSELGDFFTQTGFIEKTLKVKVILDLNQIRREDVINDKALRDALREMPGSEFTIMCCCGCQGRCCRDCC